MLRHLKTLTMLGAVLALGLTAPTADAQVLKGKTITVETALYGVGVPLHPGAKRYYKEAGLVK